MSASGTMKFSTSQGVLYGISEYAAIRPNDHNAQKSASEFFGLKTVIAAPIAPRSRSGDSCHTSHLRYISAGCTCASLPVFFQIANVWSESLMPLEFVKN